MCVVGLVMFVGVEKQPLCLFTCSVTAPRFPVNLSDNVSNSLQQQNTQTDNERLRYRGR